MENMNGKAVDLTYIPDGHTKWSYISAVEGLHGDLKFKHRPMIPEESSQIVSTISDVRDASKKDGDNRMALVCAKRISEWDNRRRDQKNEPLEITPEAVNRMPPELHAKLYLVIVGHRPSDPVPDTHTEVDEDAFQAALDGVSESEAQAKNSETG